MDADQTYNSILFKKTFDLKDESERQSITRGINTPDVMTIRSQDYVDSKNKVPGRRFTCRVDRVVVDANGTKINTFAQFTFGIPSTELQANVDVLVATFRAVVADADHIEDILNNEK
jgi:hypothetical protein